MAARYDFTIEEGSNLYKQFTLKHQDGTVLDITAYGAETYASMVLRAPDGTVVKDLTEYLTVDINTSVILLMVYGYLLVDIPYDTLEYDLYITNGLSSLRLMEGEIQVKHAKSRWWEE